MQPRPRTVRKLEFEQLFAYALNLLGGHAMTAAEVRTKLQRRAAAPEDVDRVIGRLREYKYLDDTRFAESYASARRDSGAQGKMRVLRDLRQRRVAGGIAQKAVEEAYQDVDESGLVEQWLKRKLRNVTLSEYLKDEKHLASTYRKLRYAGFSSSVSIRVLKRFAERADELEDSEEPGHSEP